MKTSVVLALLLPAVPTLRAQDTKGVSPLPAMATLTAPVTRALVVGISDYQDPAVPDLQFAHKDAEVFAQWLHSAAGGRVPAENIRLLLNEHATNGQIGAAIGWLMEETRAGDSVVIYFSGHGDMQTKMIKQLGFLLLWDTPAQVYITNALSVNLLQQCISTLSLQTKAWVWVLADACRAGKLATTGVIDTQLVAEGLARQFAAEIKILSCQPNEYSIEGRQWGGGRGVFSYYLMKGLSGWADADKDHLVSLSEIENYLQEQVTTEVAPAAQTPMTVGDKKTVVARVDTSLPNQLNQPAEYALPVFSVAEPRGLAREILARADSSILQLYTQFLTAIDSGKLMHPSGQSADDYFNLLLERPEMTPMQGTLKRTLAAALIDEGQTVVNKFLKTDPKTVDNIWKGWRYQQLPQYYQRAAELLGEKHYLYKDLKTKECYFRSKTVWLTFRDSSIDWKIRETRRWLEEALRFDSTAAYVYYDLGQTYPQHGVKAKACFLKATELAPRWALNYYMLGAQYTRSDFKIKYYRKSMELDSNLLSPCYWIAYAYEDIGRSDSADFFRQYYIDKIKEKIRTDSMSLTAYECNEAGLALWNQKRYDEAEPFFLLGQKISQGMYDVYGSLAALYTDRLQFEKALEACDLQQKKFPGKEEYALSRMGDICFYFLKDTAKAIHLYEDVQVKSPGHERRIFKAYYLAGRAEKAFPLASRLIARYPFVINLYYGAEIALKLGIKDTAEIYLNKILATDPEPEFRCNFHGTPNYVFVALAYYRLGQKDQYEKLLAAAVEQMEGDPWLYFNLARIYAASDRREAAIAALQQAVALGWEPNPLLDIAGTLCDDMLDPLRAAGGFRELVRKHFPRYYEIAVDR